MPGVPFLTHTQRSPSRSDDGSRPAPDFRWWAGRLRSRGRVRAAAGRRHHPVVAASPSVHPRWLTAKAGITSESLSASMAMPL